MTGLAPDSSSISHQWKYDVFINFRGEDTRHGFTGNLYNALKKAGVCTFLDDEELRRGDEITPTLLNAIENSRMAITVFSKDYASSTFCLNELIHIHECIKRKGRLVWPIFYDVEPSVVRHQKGNYGQSLSMHIKNLKANEDKIQSWKHALHEVANISGDHFNPGKGYEYQFIERIVKKISSKINRVLLHISDHPVGLELRVKAITSLLQIGSNSKVIMVGICGMGGLGKTTIARAVYNSIAYNFEGLCFLHDVKEKSMKLGLERIQEIILSKIVGVDIKIQDVNEGIGIMETRLKQMKILLILDNIDNHEQLKKLAGACHWFGAGSRIIITTRDEHLLVAHGVESTYNMEVFNDEESLELLSWNAVRNPQVDPCYKDVLKRAITYAQGLPLALEVIGSNLCRKTINEWESALDAYKLNLHKDIQQVLRVSYEDLGEDEKEIFLDIACFFNGKDLEYVKYMVEAVQGSNNLSYSIRVLVDKRLIKIENRHNHIEIHDLIRDMGRKIVREKSPNNPGKRSRLWFHQDIVDVLEDNMGTDDVKMIIQDDLSKCIEVNWDGEAFKSMKELKVIIFENAQFSENSKYLPNSLKVLKWRRYPSSCLPPNFRPKKLVVLEVEYSSLSSLEAIKTSRNLGVLNLRDSQYVTEIPNLSSLGNLKELNLGGCKNLIEIHDSIGYLAELETLDVEGCVQLKTFPCRIKSPSLEKLNLNHCSSLKYFPEILEKVKITELSLVGTGIEKLPWSTCNLSELMRLKIEHHNSVMEIPNSIFLLPELNSIHIDGDDGKVMISCDSKEAQQQAICPENCGPYDGYMQYFNLQRCNISDDLLRIDLNRYINVGTLDLSGTNFTILPSWVKKCHYLWTLRLNECKNLREVEGIPPKIRDLEAINCMSLSSEAKSLLLSEEFHGDPGRVPLGMDIHCEGEIHFLVPSIGIPKWFDYTSEGASISFWFRNSFPPLLCLCLLLKTRDGVLIKSNYSYSVFASVYINDEQVLYRDLERGMNALKDDHLVVYNLIKCCIPHYVMEGFCRNNKWNHVEVHVEVHGGSLTDDGPVVIEKSGMYVNKQLYEMGHFSFTNPDQDSAGTLPSRKQACGIGTPRHGGGEWYSLHPWWGRDIEFGYRVCQSPRREEEEEEEEEEEKDDDDDLFEFSSVDCYKASLMNLDLNTTPLPMLPWAEHACDTFRNQGHSIEDDKWLSLRPCWETPFYDESANHQEFQQGDNVTSTNVEQVPQGFEDTGKAKGKEIVIYNDTINE